MEAAARLADDQADRWVDHHAEPLFRYALTRLRRREDAEDAVQECLLAAIQARSTFRGDSTERSWLIGILRHKIVDRIRRAARDGAVEEAQDDAMDTWCGMTGRWLRPPQAWQADPGALVENREFWEVVRQCFGGLNPRHAQAFSLRTLDDVPAEDICKQLDITPSNLWVILHRARTRLRECLEPSWFARGGRR